METIFNFSELVERLNNRIAKIKHELDMINEVVIVRRCNTIVCDPTRLMTYDVDQDNKVVCKWNEIHATLFTPKTAKELINAKLTKDNKGEVINMVAMSQNEYLTLLLKDQERGLEAIKSMM